MNAIRVETTIQQDGELHLTDIPCKKGDRVEATVLVLAPPVADDEREKAFQRLLERAERLKLYSTIPYPTRDELYDRS